MAIKKKFPHRTATVYCNGGCRAKKKMDYQAASCEEAMALCEGGPLECAYGCLGYDTFGPFKWIGGIAKGHPTQEECREAAAFFQGLLQGAGGPEDL